MVVVLSYSVGFAAGPVNDTTFEELVLKSPVPVMVDFWAPWCGPCRMIAPLIDELAVEYGDRLRAVRLLPACVSCKEAWGRGQAQCLELCAGTPHLHFQAKCCRRRCGAASEVQACSGS